MIMIAEISTSDLHGWQNEEYKSRRGLPNVFSISKLKVMRICRSISEHFRCLGAIGKFIEPYTIKFKGVFHVSFVK